MGKLKPWCILEPYVWHQLRPGAVLALSNAAQWLITSSPVQVAWGFLLLLLFCFVFEREFSYLVVVKDAMPSTQEL